MSVESAYQVRGYSLSGRRPAAVLSLAYEWPAGVYANGALIGSLDEKNAPYLLGGVADLGYARRVAPGASLDLGVVRNEYSRLGASRRSTGYTEAYIGVVGRRLTGRLYYSPDYFRRGVHTLYGELQGSIEPADGVRLEAHVGALTYLDLPSRAPRPDTQYDWRLAVTRAFGRFEMHAALSGGGPGRDYYDGRARDRTALTAGASWAF